MKVTYIKASAPGPFKTYKKQRGGPPQNIFSAAAATPKDIEVVMVDETAGMTPDLKAHTDLVIIFSSTPDVLHAYALGETFRAHGRKVIFAGLHASFMPDEAARHGDSVIIGEIELLLPQVFEDLRAGALKPRYETDDVVDMTTLNPYPTDLISPEKYGWMWSVLVSRGCKFPCEFCLVNKFFTGMRYRPVEDVVREVKAIQAKGADWIELHSDNLCLDKAYAKELFLALEPLGMNWAGETTITIAEDEELLELAARSGMGYLLIGLETPSRAALKDVGKAFVKPERVKENIRRIHEYGVVVDSCMIFGFDAHGPEVFEESLDYVQEVGVDVCAPVILSPYPGSSLYKRLDEEGRILTKDWSKFDGTNAVFQPKGMTAEDLEYGVGTFMNDYYAAGRVIRRKYRQFRDFGLGTATALPL